MIFDRAHKRRTSARAGGARAYLPTCHMPTPLAAPTMTYHLTSLPLPHVVALSPRLHPPRFALRALSLAHSCTCRKALALSKAAAVFSSALSLPPRAFLAPRSSPLSLPPR